MNVGMFLLIKIYVDRLYRILGKIKILKVEKDTKV